MKHLPRSLEPCGDTFTTTDATAEQLWAESILMPIIDSSSHLRRHKLRQSVCGQWAVRKSNLKNIQTAGLTAEEFSQVAMGEFQRLEKHGISVISRAMVASSSTDVIFTITPWLPSLRPASEDEYATIVPKLHQYYDRPEEDLVLHDIDFPANYSCYAEPFLHDTDPYLATLGQTLKYGLIKL